MEGWFAALQLVLREVALFAAAGYLLLGLSDLLIDLIWLGRTARRRLSRRAAITFADLPPPRAPGPLAVFVPAWDEAGIVDRMLAQALARFDHGDYRIFVGCYPNDPATLAAVRAIGDARLHLVVNDRPGPTTKADCLNALWRGMCAVETASGRTFKAVILHDAEDVVHSAELRLFDRLIEEHALVQLPVLPIPRPSSRYVSGIYLDFFAEAHGKELVVRTALGASLPSAGVGCAFDRALLGQLADAAGPFDADSVTEDYELGLRLHALGVRGAFVRMRASPGKPLIATHEYFPATLDEAVKQQARWMLGIALAGWTRLGWRGGPAEWWMRLRDRQSLLAALLLVCGYTAAFLFAFVQVGVALGGKAEPLPPALVTMLEISLLLLGWRLLVRFAFTARHYSWVDGLRSVPRAIVANLVAVLAAEQALERYREWRRTGRPRWDKTAHSFPDALPAE